MPDKTRIGLVLVTGQGVPLSVAYALEQRLASHPRLGMAFPMARVEPATDDGGDRALQQATALVQTAEMHYRDLQPQRAIDAVRDSVAVLERWLDRPGAAPLLARALRIRGLTELYLEQVQAAGSSFAAASFLDSDFVPGAELWPPPARLAYADAVATSRRLNPSSLSLRVQPDVAAVWLDGRYVGAGSRTVQDVRAGDHHLLATCPGHQRLAAVVSVQGDRRLADAAIFLQPLAEQGVSAGTCALQQIAAHLLAGDGRVHEGIAIRQAAALLGAEALVVVAAVLGEGSAEGARAVPSAWVLHPELGRAGGAAVPLDNIDFAADEIIARLVGRFAVESGAAGTREPWYGSWVFWTAAGALVLATASVVSYAVLMERPSERVTLVLGR